MRLSVQLSRQGRWTILTIMTGLFITTILNLISVWYIIYHDIVIHDATRETMAETVVLSPAASNQRLTYGHATLALSILIADGFLVSDSLSILHRSSQPKDCRLGELTFFGRETESLGFYTRLCSS